MTNRQLDENGFITIPNNPISREGVFPYLGSSIGADEPDKVYYVYRPASELEDEECINSFKLLPIIDDHEMLGLSEDGLTPAEEKGVHGSTGESVDFKDGVLYSNLKIFSEKLANLIKSGKKDLSLGYRCVYEKSKGIFAGQSYDFIQRSLRGNHLALVDEARCNVSVLDHHYTFDKLDISIRKGTQMENEKKTEDNELTLESLAAKLDALADVVMKLAPAEDKTFDEEEKAKDAAEEEKKAEDEEVPTDTTEGGNNDDSKALASALDSIKGLESQIAQIKKNAFKAVMDEASKRDKLADKISIHVGAFDHKEKTLQEVAEYGVSKLGLKCPKGHETTALDSYFAAANKELPKHTMDGKKSNIVNSFINGQ